MPHLALHQDGDGLLHLVADHAAHQGALVLGCRGRFCGRRLFGRHLGAFSLIMVRTRAMSRRTFFIWLVLVSCCVASCMRSPNCAFSRSVSSFESSSLFLARSSLDFMAYPNMRWTNAVLIGSLAAARANASRA